MVSSLAVFVIASSALLGQTQAPPSNAEHMQALEWAIGTWKTEVDAMEAIPGVVKVGDKLHITLSFDWRLNKNASAVNWYLETSGGVRVVEHQGMIGWDPSKKTYISGDFDSIGGHGHSVWSRVGDSWHLTTRGFEADGTAVSSTLVLSDIAQKTFSSQTINEKVVTKSRQTGRNHLGARQLDRRRGHLRAKQPPLSGQGCGFPSPSRPAGVWQC